MASHAAVRLGSPFDYLIINTSIRISRFLAWVHDLTNLSFGIGKKAIALGYLSRAINGLAKDIKYIVDRVDREPLRPYIARNLYRFERCYTSLRNLEEVVGSQLNSRTRKQLRRALRDLEHLIECAHEFRGEESTKQPLYAGTQEEGGCAMWLSDRMMRIASFVRSYFVSFWGSLLVYGAVFVFGLGFTIRSVAYGHEINGTTALIAGMVIGSVLVLIRIFSDLDYWRTSDGH